MCMHRLSKYILRKAGWTIHGHPPPLEKFVVVGAPHTSNMDFIIARLYFFMVKKKPHFLIKKEIFVFPFRKALLKLGGIPVDRTMSGNIVDNMVRLFNERDRFILSIAPEGTRKKVSNWKKGFYYIAGKANVPVVVAYIDYKKKRIGISEPYFMGPDPGEELVKIKRFVKDATPKHPEKFTVGNLNSSSS